jgi:hypothetical protein
MKGHALHPFILVEASQNTGSTLFTKLGCNGILEEERYAIDEIRRSYGKSRK